MFDSAKPASDGNPGFATGPELVAFAESLRTEIDGSITDLVTMGQQIVAAARTLHTTDVDNAIGISRIATALNGLGAPPR